MIRKALFRKPQDVDNMSMMLMDRNPAASAAPLTAVELSDRTRVAPVTMVPRGPRGLWAALAAAALRHPHAASAAPTTGGAPVAALSDERVDRTPVEFVELPMAV
ncbi:MAG: hypothetical protein ACKOYM_05940 [Actinomycetes bacterium]